MSNHSWAFAVAFVATIATPVAAQDEFMGRTDIGAGRAAFRIHCASCHSLEAGKTIKGPSLKGVYGRAIGSDRSFAYSSALRDRKGAWTEPTLNTYLRDPFEMGTDVNMVVHGMTDDRMRGDVIAFLKFEAK